MSNPPEETPSAPTAEHVWELIQKLSETERERYWAQVADGLTNPASPTRVEYTGLDAFWGPVLEALKRQVCQAISQEIARVAGPAIAASLVRNAERISDDAKAAYKQTRDVKPRNTERDAEIVRLRDGERLTYGQIARRLKQINPAWVNPNGTCLSYEAIKRAYRRARR